MQAGMLGCLDAWMPGCVSGLEGFGDAGLEGIGDGIGDYSCKLARSGSGRGRRIYIYIYTSVNPCNPCTVHSRAEQSRTELCCFRAALFECSF